MVFFFPQPFALLYQHGHEVRARRIEGNLPLERHRAECVVGLKDHLAHGVENVGLPAGQQH